ncbi:MAG TPA: hypothetical protein VGI70_14630 [Polyangiales bacterium]|jgi:hypothetical protein
MRHALIALTLMAAACGSALPSRYVIEHDLGAYAFRRYQKSFDIEIPIADNAATGYTAAYLQRTGRDQVDVITAFVTVYARANALAAEAHTSLSTLAGYTLKNAELSGQNVWLLEGNGREHWCIWVSENRIVKIGAPNDRAFPEAVIDAYAALYPSDLNEHGSARPDAASAGQPKVANDDASERDVPANLRESAPR